MPLSQTCLVAGIQWTGIVNVRFSGERPRGGRSISVHWIPADGLIGALTTRLRG